MLGHGYKRALRPDKRSCSGCVFCKLELRIVCPGLDVCAAVRYQFLERFELVAFCAREAGFSSFASEFRANDGKRLVFPYVRTFWAARPVALASFNPEPGFHYPGLEKNHLNDFSEKKAQPAFAGCPGRSIILVLGTFTGALMLSANASRVPTLLVM